MLDTVNAIAQRVIHNPTDEHTLLVLCDALEDAGLDNTASQLQLCLCQEKRAIVIEVGDVECSLHDIISDTNWEMHWQCAFQISPIVSINVNPSEVMDEQSDTSSQSSGYDIIGAWHEAEHFNAWYMHPEEYRFRQNYRLAKVGSTPPTVFLRWLLLSTTYRYNVLKGTVKPE